MEAHTVAVKPQFEDAAQQHESATLGLWVFLATEVLFFGVLIAAYTVYRYEYPQVVAAMGRHMDLAVGTVNTGILLTSSLTVALAVFFARARQQAKLVVCLAATAVLGLAFDALKFYEYYGHYKEHLLPGAGFNLPDVPAGEGRLVFALYYIATGVHALHVLIGVGFFAGLAFLAGRGRFQRGNVTPVEMCGLYWHFVDIVWIFLYPLFYFAGGR